MQQPDINPARLARFEPLIEHLPGTAEDRAWEQLVAEYRVPESCGFLISAPIRWR
jgi:hypothetical protein